MARQRPLLVIVPKVSPPAVTQSKLRQPRTWFNKIVDEFEKLKTYILQAVVPTTRGKASIYSKLGEIKKTKDEKTFAREREKVIRQLKKKTHLTGD